MEPPKKKLERIKSSVFSRSLSLAKLTLKSGVQLAGQGIKNSMSSDATANTNWQLFLKNQAQSLSTELGELKGSLMKAGQMLSMYGEQFFPPEANDFLKSLQSDSPPLVWSAIEKVLRLHFTPEQLEQLEIEHESLASASLGQVHRARIKATGEEIVLKIQYPNVDKAIDSDLRAIRTFLNMFKLIPQDFNPDSLFAEVRSMLIQETDYELEAQNLKEYTKLLDRDSRFVIPKYYAEFSNKRVLAMSFEKGLRVDDPIIQNLSQAKRNQLALNYLDLFFKEIFVWKVVQTDPHLGNYKIRMNPFGDDQIVLLDFGATRFYQDEFLKHYHQMIRGVLNADHPLFLEAAQNLAFLRENDDPKLIKLFEEFCFETVEPFIEPSDPRNIHGLVDKDGYYDWKNTDLPRRITKKIFEVIKYNAWRTPPQEILFLDRKTGGVFIFLSVLRAKIRGRDVVTKYL
jgi:predicted unusual protein kinase regulating ubiquinone biosynthesis (AarF/ABC1/UbiB family)